MSTTSPFISLSLLLVAVLCLSHHAWSLPTDKVNPARSAALKAAQNKTALAASLQSRYIISELNWNKFCDPLGPYRQKEVSSGPAWCMEEWKAFVLNDDEKSLFLKEIQSMKPDDIGTVRESDNKYNLVQCRDIDWEDKKHDSDRCTNTLRSHYVEPLQSKENVTIKFKVFSLSPLIMSFLTNDTSYTDIVEPEQTEIRARIVRSNSSLILNVQGAQRLIESAAAQNLLRLPRMLRAAYEVIPEGSRPKNSQGDTWEGVPPEVAAKVKEEYERESVSIVTKEVENKLTTLDGLAKAMQHILTKKTVNGTDAKKSEKISNTSYNYKNQIEDKLLKIDKTTVMVALSRTVTHSLHTVLGIDNAFPSDSKKDSALSMSRDVDLVKKDFQQTLDDIESQAMDATATAQPV